MTPAQRQQMILEHVPLVRTIAGRMVRRFPSNVQVEELVSEGIVGLYDALDKFDGSRGVPFKAYAEIRIRGRIMDALRAADWVPRAVRRKCLRIDAARNRLRTQLKRDPTRDEMARELEMSVEAYDDLCGDAEIRRLISLDTPLDEEGGATIGDQVAEGGEDLLDSWIAGETVNEMWAAVERLNERERTVVTLYYARGLQLKEIGEKLGVTESRVCQISGSAVKKLSTWLRRPDPGRRPRAAQAPAVAGA